jgi:DNA-binding Lrp family transcriptional regulator
MEGTKYDKVFMFDSKPMIDLELLELVFEVANKYSFLAFCFVLLLLMLYYFSQQEQKKLQSILNAELQSKTSKLEEDLDIVKKERNELRADARNKGLLASQFKELNELTKLQRSEKLIYILRFAQKHEQELRFININPIKILAKDKSLGVRRYATKSLARVKTKESFEAVLDLVDTDPHPAIQVFALYLCGKYLPEVVELKKAFYPRIKQIIQENTSPLINQEAAWVINKMDDVYVHPQTYRPNDDDSKCLAFVLIKGLAPNNQSLLEDFNRINRLSKYGIMEFGIVFGTYNTIIKVLSDNINDLNQTILRDLQDLSWVESTRTLIVINERYISYWSKSSNINRVKSMSYVLFSTPASDTHGLISCLWDYDFSQSRIIEAAGVYGEADVIARIEADSDQERDNLICRIIKELSPLVKTCDVLTVQNGTFDQDDTQKNSSLFQVLSVGEIPEEYASLSENTVKNYSKIK